MDCEQFDQVAVDLLYGELPEGEAAAARRHTDQCGRCSSTFSALRSAHRSASFDLEEPPARIDAVAMEAAKAAQRQIPWHRKTGRLVSWAGSYAMRPQVAMGALLLLMIGSSLLLLRGRPGTGHLGLVRVTEHGVPERDRGDYPGFLESAGRGVPDNQAPSYAGTPIDGGPERMDGPAPSGSRTVGEPSRSGEYDDAMATFEAKEFAKAQRMFEAIAAQGGPESAPAALYSAKAIRALSGCGAALPKLDAVIARHSRTAAAVQARWESAACNRLVGNYERARQMLADLRSIEGQRERAEHELARLGPAPRTTRPPVERRPAAGLAIPSPTKAQPGMR